ncbi:hypothetical protein OIDMADRAFT_169075 [Oidiodendron maius Zn]|uniref:Uncharacterized protein n=1 Tax=Oidiodendron maius (strain Zn) TaxID=913774 RepID=A0A0C3GMI7_OIDMZ|nr:hypothetical protein OIDMADRAFT_169075 [Oidiodendron maius Zn]
MPVARGTSTVTVNNSDVPADYIIHHSGHQSSPDGPTASHRTLAHDIEQQDNPTWWPTDHRRVPNYRPINRNLDWDQRPGGTNAIEMIFIFTMLRGVQLNANLSHIWRHTGGYFNERLFRYEIGGER